MKIALEDSCEDIVGKALRGLGIAEANLAEATGVTQAQVAAIRRGGGDEASLRAIAPVLGLDPDKLVASKNKAWLPDVSAVEGLFMTNQPYHDMFVNAYLVWDSASKSAAIFDTGVDTRPMLEMVQSEGLEVRAIYLTHTHNDHIQELGTLRKRFPEIPVYVSEREHPTFTCEYAEHGQEFGLGKLRIAVRQTWGHTRGGLTYVISGLSKPLALVGDAIFAGSMGGGTVSYADALRTNREQILSLPDETILCPGHGPLSTVGLEKQHNPFF